MGILVVTGRVKFDYKISQDSRNDLHFAVSCPFTQGCAAKLRRYRRAVGITRDFNSIHRVIAVTD